MPRNLPLFNSIRPLLTRVASIIDTHRWSVLAVAAVIGGTALAALVAQTLPANDRITIGNTAGSLTAVIEINGARVLVGAGPTRSHAADLIGRSTRPWNRDIDLLIVPGWDDGHAAGALGLLERRNVNAIAVVGVPGDEPIWTMMERRARQDDVELRYLSTAHKVSLSPDAVLHVAALEPSAGAWIRLEYHGIRADLVDAEQVDAAEPPLGIFENRNEHIVVNMRSQGSPHFAEPRLLIQPSPFYQDDFSQTDARFVREVERNSQVRLDLADNEIRLPVAGIDF